MTAPMLPYTHELNPKWPAESSSGFATLLAPIARSCTQSARVDQKVAAQSLKLKAIAEDLERLRQEPMAVVRTTSDNSSKLVDFMPGELRRHVSLSDPARLSPDDQDTLTPDDLDSGPTRAHTTEIVVAPSKCAKAIKPIRRQKIARDPILWEVECNARRCESNTLPPGEEVVRSNRCLDRCLDRLMNWVVTALERGGYLK